MSPGLVLLTNFVVALALLAVATSYRLVRLLSRHSVALAALPLVTAVVVTLYVFGEDSYRGNGISRWDAYRSPGGALGSMYVLSVALMAGCAALLFYAGLQGRHVSVWRVTALAGGLTSLILLTATILGFTLNWLGLRARVAGAVCGPGSPRVPPSARPCHPARLAVAFSGSRGRRTSGLA